MTSTTLKSMAKFVVSTGTLFALCIGVGFIAHARTLEVMEASKGNGTLDRAAYGLDYFER
jgi:hypothetical protein|tara:strand:- start:799 stop:978 length:180 start_codon:yes stop_codon:yes gene_type:complete